jgi:hypothetical protein
MAKPSLMDGFSEAAEDTSDESGVDSGAAFEELRKRFLNGDPEEAKDAFSGLIALCDDDSGEPAQSEQHKPSLHIMIGTPAGFPKH